MAATMEEAPVLGASDLAALLEERAGIPLVVLEAWMVGCTCTPRAYLNGEQRGQVVHEAGCLLAGGGRA
jgi:hypothetical protein